MAGIGWTLACDSGSYLLSARQGYRTFGQEFDPADRVGAKVHQSAAESRARATLFAAVPIAKPFVESRSLIVAVPASMRITAW